MCETNKTNIMNKRLIEIKKINGKEYVLNAPQIIFPSQQISLGIWRANEREMAINHTLRLAELKVGCCIEYDDGEDIKEFKPWGDSYSNFVDCIYAYLVMKETKWFQDKSENTKDELCFNFEVALRSAFCVTHYAKFTSAVTIGEKMSCFSGYCIDE